MSGFRRTWKSISFRTSSTNNVSEILNLDNQVTDLLFQVSRSAFGNGERNLDYPGLPKDQDDWHVDDYRFKLNIYFAKAWRWFPPLTSQPSILI